MNIIYLILIILGVAGQGIVKKPYANKTGDKGAYIYSAVTSFVSMLFFVATSKEMQWNITIVPYAIAFALSYATSGICGGIAIANGPLSLSSLMTSYSLMIPTFYGLIFLKDPMNVYLPIGIAMLAISIFLINKKNDQCPITAKWLILILIATLGNGLCSTFQKYQSFCTKRLFPECNFGD